PLDEPPFFPELLPVDASDEGSVSYGRTSTEPDSKLFFVMAEGYCVKCKARKEIMDAVEETMKNGRKAIKGKCPSCGTVMFKILGKAATAESAAAKTEKPAEKPNPSNP